MATDQHIESLEEESSTEPSSPPTSAGLSRAANQGRESESPSSSSFIFITTNEKTGKAHAESRMLVRSHVMSSYYRLKKLSQSQSESPPRDIESAGHVGKFKLESYPQGRKPRRRKEKAGKATPILNKEKPSAPSSVPRNLPGSAPLDPFAVAALPWDSHMQFFVQHCRYLVIFLGDA
jgi:hypothetical protein